MQTAVTGRGPAGAGLAAAGGGAVPKVLPRATGLSHAGIPVNCWRSVSSLRTQDAACRRQGWRRPWDLVEVEMEAIHASGYLQFVNRL